MTATSTSGYGRTVDGARRRRPALFVVTALSSVVGLLGLAGVFASGTDRATTGVNDAFSGDNPVTPSDIDLQLASATFDLATGAFTCGNDWQEDLTSGVVTSDGAEISGQYPYFDDLDEGLLCIRNVGTAPADLSVSTLDVTNEELTTDGCSPGELEVDPGNCGYGIGELGDYLYASFANATDGTATGPVDESTSGGNCYELANGASPLTINELATDSYDIGQLAPGQVRGICADVIWQRSAISQSDRTTWRYAFDAVPAANGGDDNLPHGTATDPSTCTFDTYEPNDSITQAAPVLNRGLSITASSCTGDVDWYYNNAIGSQVATFSLDWTDPNVDLDLQVYGSQNELLAESVSSSGTHEEIEFDAGAVYNVVVIPNGTFESETYTLAVSAP